MKMARFSMSDYLARSLASVAFNTRLQRPEVTSPGDFFLFHERLHLRLGAIPKIMRQRPWTGKSQGGGLTPEAGWWPAPFH